MTKEEQYIKFLEESIKTANSIQTEAAYIICLETFKKIFIKK